MSRFIALLSILFGSFLVAKEEPVLILNDFNRATVLPVHFRTCQDTLKVCGGAPAKGKGLPGLKLSGSGQFSKHGLQQILVTLCHPKLTVIDLREESHGFINGAAVSWFIAKDRLNAGKALDEIEADERLRLNQIKGQALLTIYEVESKNASNAIENTISVLLKPRQAEIERAICDQVGANYVRIPVADHMRPSDAAVDSFLCAAGDGRTTTFLSIVDMLHNARQVSFEEILQRQHELGGIDLTHLPAADDWKYEGAKARLEFLRQFYKFCLEKKRQSWSSFVQK
jgi:hypothetical protein